MQEAAPRFDELGVGLLGVSIAADYQARWLQEKQGIEYPLLIDPDGDLKRSLDFRKMKLWRYLVPTTWWRYLRVWGRSRQGAMTGSPTEVPGVAIIDADGALRYRYEGVTLGDYPTIDQILAAAAEIGTA